MEGRKRRGRERRGDKRKGGERNRSKKEGGGEGSWVVVYCSMKISGKH